MSAGDNTKDDRWRPGFASSERRVREELAAAAAEAEAEQRVFSRELSFVPAQSKPKFEAHDAQTRVMIEEQKRLEQLRHGESVVQRLDKWKWMNRMSGPAEKQAHLEPLIQAVRRDPVTNEDILVFLLIAFEPIRRGVSAEFMRARGGLATPDLDIDWANRAEARMVREIDKQTLYDVTRNATIEALFRYPSPPPDRLFPWLRETISWRALDQLRSELSDLETTVYNAAEAEALQAALADLDQVDPPAMGEAAGLREWRRGFRLRSLYETVEAFYDVERRAPGVHRRGRTAAALPSRSDRRSVLPGPHRPTARHPARRIAQHHLQHQRPREEEPARGRLLLRRPVSARDRPRSCPCRRARRPLPVGPVARRSADRLHRPGGLDHEPALRDRAGDLERQQPCRARPHAPEDPRSTPTRRPRHRRQLS